MAQPHRRLNRCCRFICGLLLFVACAGSIVEAEELSVAGLKFQVDELTPIDAENIKLGIGGESLIIPKYRLEDHLVEVFLAKPEYVATLENKQLETFVIESMRALKIERAQLGLQALFTRHSDQPKYVQQFFESLPANIERAAITDLYHTLILKLRDSEQFRAFLTYPMYRIGLSDPDWLRVNATATVYQLASNLKNTASQEFSKALAANDLSTIESILRFLQELFGHNDAVYRKFRLAQSRILEVKQLLEQKKVELITPWLQGIKNDPELFKLLGSFVFDILQEQIQLFLQSGRPDLALRVLVWIEPERRTPQIHSYVLQILANLNSEQRENLADSSVADVLLLYANNDPAISLQYQNVLSEQIFFCLKQGRPDQSEYYFSQLLKFKLHDYDLLDRIRIEQALAYGRKGFNALARKKLQQVSGRIGIIDRVHLAMMGLYSHNVMRIVLVFSILTFGSAWFLVRYRRIANEMLAAQQSTDGFSAESVDEKTKVTFSARSRGRDPRIEEYAVCLRVLGLQSDSTLKEIKTAYRSKVKVAHPDRQASGSDTASDRFIQLTSAYERALELRTELGIVDS